MRLFQSVMRMNAVGPVLCLGVVCVAGGALAQMVNQTPVGPDPAQTALGQEVMECVGGKVQLRARVNQLEAEIAQLKASAAKPPEKTP